MDEPKKKKPYVASSAELGNEASTVGVSQMASTNPYASYAQSAWGAQPYDYSAWYQAQANSASNVAGAQQPVAQNAYQWNTYSQPATVNANASVSQATQPASYSYPSYNQNGVIQQQAVPSQSSAYQAPQNSYWTTATNQLQLQQQQSALSSGGATPSAGQHQQQPTTSASSYQTAAAQQPQALDGSSSQSATDYAAYYQNAAAAMTKPLEGQAAATPSSAADYAAAYYQSAAAAYYPYGYSYPYLPTWQAPTPSAPAATAAQQQQQQPTQAYQAPAAQPVAAPQPAAAPAASSYTPYMPYSYAQALTKKPSGPISSTPTTPSSLAPSLKPNDQSSSNGIISGTYFDRGSHTLPLKFQVSTSTSSSSSSSGAIAGAKKDPSSSSSSSSLPSAVAAVRSSSSASDSRDSLSIGSSKTLAPTPNASSTSITKSGSTSASSFASDANSGEAKWPPKLRQYVERAFDRCKNDSDRAITEAFLKKVIQASIPILWTKEWDKERLPQLPNADRNDRSTGERKSRWAGSASWASSSSSRKVSPSSKDGDNDSVNGFHGNSKKKKENNSINNSKRKDKRILPTERRSSPSDDGFDQLEALSHQSSKKKQKQSRKEFSMVIKNDPQEEARRQKRFSRFEDMLVAQRASPSLTTKRKPKLKFVYSTVQESGGAGDEQLDWDSLTIKGTNQNLEKTYLRLTSAPDPSTVRPEEILRESLKIIKKKWREKPEYLYTCEQLKSIRQDLTVQRIRNQLTVDVYETHARIALEKNDLAEYNACQTQLKVLYKEGITGNMMEFIAYRILYNLHHNISLDIADVLVEVTAQGKAIDKCVEHALNVRKAVALGNYHAFFKLYSEAPNMGGYLMDLFIGRMRVNAFRCIVKSFRPDVELAWLQKELAFDSLEPLLEFLTQQNAILTPDQTSLDTKSTDK